MKKTLFTNQREIDGAIKATRDHFRTFLKNQSHCIVCGCTPKPDEWSPEIENCCFDCV